MNKQMLQLLLIKTKGDQTPIHAASPQHNKPS